MPYNNNNINDKKIRLDDLHEIFREGIKWPWDDVIQLWVNSEKPRNAAMNNILFESEKLFLDGQTYAQASWLVRPTSPNKNNNHNNIITFVDDIKSMSIT